MSTEGTVSRYVVAWCHAGWAAIQPQNELEKTKKQNKLRVERVEPKYLRNRCRLFKIRVSINTVGGRVLNVESIRRLRV